MKSMKDDIWFGAMSDTGIHGQKKMTGGWQPSNSLNSILGRIILQRK